MPKSKKPTPTQRQTPYPTPATPANPNPRFNSATPTNTRSTPTATSNPGARFLLPPRGFALGFPNPAYPQTTLTPFEAGQSLHDFCLDLQNGTQRPGDVGEDVHLGSGGVRGIEGDGKSAYDAPANGEGSGTGRKRRVEKVVRDSGVDHAEEISKKTSALSKRREDKDSFDPPLSKRQNRPPTGPSEEQIVRDGAVDHGEMISKTLKLSKRREDKGTLYPPSTQGQDQPPIGFSENPPTILDPCPPEQYLNSPKDSTPSDSDLAPPNSLTEQISLADILKPVANFNARTPWPVRFYGQPVSPPIWHANCPGGYKPTTLAGYPQRRQYTTYIPAAHNADIVRDESGHCCIDLDEWDRCVMGKCGGCEICRPGA